MKGPLVVEWLEVAATQFYAGTLGGAAISVLNVGSATWRPNRVKLSYHWLDRQGNPILWDGLRTELPERISPGSLVHEHWMHVRAPIPPGPYRLSVDLVDEGRFWFSELGNPTVELDLDVRPRDASGAVAHVNGIEPSAEWHDLVRAAHERGYAAVGGSIERGRRGPKELEPYAPGGGRDPAFGAPLVCPSLLPPLEPNAEVAGLPAWLPEGDEPWLYDGRITARLRADRRRG